MSARYRIQHASSYAYGGPVTASFNEARLTPLHTPWQTRLDSSIHIEPSTWQYRYTDYWGTEVRVFEANAAHRALEIRATSLIEVDVRHRPAPAALAWADLREDAVRDEFVEYLGQSSATRPPAELADLADSIAADGAPGAAARLICESIHGALTYRPGATEVHTTASEAWAARSGVCQDYAHLAVGALRHVGLPARYVSGYLHPAADPAVGETAQGESHAWVEWWQGEWTAYDPTNAAEVAERHVMIGSGRDYTDVPPIKGIVAGPQQTSTLSVSVDITRLA
jgi:transglutaminase-like putative cysteine protease